MTIDVQTQSRTEYLLSHDPQIRAAAPIAEVVAAARVPGLRLPEVLNTLVEGYADRPALGTRARALSTDDTTGRSQTRLLPHFDTITYRGLWSDVLAVANAWHEAPSPVQPGEFVATIGFASADYLTVDLVCGYLGLVAVPLQHNSSASRLQPIFEETRPAVLAVSAAYLDLATESALHSPSVRRLVVFDYDAEVNDHREALEQARSRLADIVGGWRSEGSAGTIDTGSHSDRATEPTKSRALISLRLGYRNIHPYSIFGEDSYARRTIFRLQ